MQTRNPVCRWIVPAATAFGSFVNAGAAKAQSCAMCYNTAAAAKAAAIQALRSGILILLVPVALLFIGIFVLAFRSKERFGESSQEEIGYDQGMSNRVESLRLKHPHPRTFSPKEEESIGEYGPLSLGREGRSQGPGEGVVQRS